MGYTPGKELETGGSYRFAFPDGNASVARLLVRSLVPGALPGKPLPDGSPGPSLYCAVIVKTVDAQTRSKTGINELLRD